MRAKPVKVDLFIVQIRDMSRGRRIKFYASVGLRACETTLKICSCKTLTPKEISTGSFLERRGRDRNADPSLISLRLKKSRLRNAALVIAELHGNRARFCTVTFRFSGELRDKKFFQKKLRYLFKKLNRAGYGIAYSGMMERHEGRKRADGIGSGAWHFHFLAYRSGGVLWRGVPAWDYERMQRIAVSLDGNIDFRELDRSRDSGKKISSYMSKLDSVVVAAYMAKQKGGEDYCYTMTSKGCDLPKHAVYDAQLAYEFINAGGFEKKEGGGFPYYLSRDRKFSREFYDSV